MNHKLHRKALYQDFFSFLFCCLYVGFVLFQPVFAAGDLVGNKLDDVKKGICALLKGLNVLSIATVTIAIMWCGYKWLYKHAELSEIARIFIGALFIAGSSQIAAMLIPKETNSCDGLGGGGGSTT